jgi:nucleoid-associated protein YgaU
MVRGLFIMAAVGFLLVSGYGCGIKARTYVAERERVDQANTGNAGYVKGQGGSMAGRPTRKIYVVEFEREKKAPKKPASKPVAAAPASQPAMETTGAAVTETPEAAGAAVASAETAVVTASDGKITQYTVQKDDTLQKISKKVYNSYGQWTKIYEANKDKIKNPNFVKPGTVLTIPQE